MSQERVTLLLGLTLLVGIVLVVGTTILMVSGTNDFFTDLSCLLTSAILIIITYFAGITTELIFSLIFIFLRLTCVMYQCIYHDLFSYGSLFRLIMPPLYHLTIYTVTYQIRTVKEENIRLHKKTSRLDALDAVTNLRTVEMYKERFGLFSNISTHYGTSLYLVVTRTAYWESIRNLLSPEQKNESLQIMTTVVREITNNRFLPYPIDNTPPTWALLIFRDRGNGYTTRKGFEQQVQEKFAHSETLRNVTLTLQVSYIRYGPVKFNNASEFLGDGISPFQCDAQRGGEQVTEELATLTRNLTEVGVLNETQPSSMRLHLENIRTKSNPGSIVPSFSHGIISSMLIEQLEESIPLSHLKRGTKVHFIIAGLSPMTMSIPPHVGRQAIELIEEV